MDQRMLQLSKCRDDLKMRPLTFDHDEWAGNENIAVRHETDGSVRVYWSLGSEPGRTAHIQVWFDPNDTGTVRQVQLYLADGMNPSDLRRFAWKKWINVAEAATRSLRDPTGGQTDLLVENIYSARTNTRSTRMTPGKRRGRPSNGDDFYREVAADYNRMFAEHPKSPTLALSNLRNVSRNTAAGHVRKARALGYLPPARRGKPG